QRAVAVLRSAGGVYHRLPRALPDRRAPRTGILDLEAVPAGDGVCGGQSGAVLPAQFAQPCSSGGSVLSGEIVTARESPARFMARRVFCGGTLGKVAGWKRKQKAGRGWHRNSR